MRRTEQKYLDKTVDILNICGILSIQIKIGGLFYD